MKIKVQFGDTTIPLPFYLIRNDEDESNPYIGFKYSDMAEHIQHGDCISYDSDKEGTETDTE